jgi:mono/diheme cytochrome c family protein
MSRTARLCSPALLAALALMLLPAASRAATDANADLIARGKYLVTLSHCKSCHTANGGPAFAGGRYMPTPFGPLSTPNITPDKETGIGTWSEADFDRALREGIAKGGRHLYPVMPYPWFNHLTDDDLSAIHAYIFSLKPVHHPRPRSKISFPFNIRIGLAVWNWIFLKEGPFKPDPTKSAEVNRGAYIVNVLEHCGECHNKNNLLGDTGWARHLQGGPLQHWYAPNITPDKDEGIGRFSEDQVYSYLKYGYAEGMGTALGPMHETVDGSLSKMKDSDLHAVVAYLFSNAPKHDYKEVERSDFTGHEPQGAETYLSYCASCHQADGRGIEGQVPALADNGVVRAEGPDDILRVILGGVEAQGSYGPMPALGVGMTDQQVAAVANYVRQSWGNKAPPNAAPGEVAVVRGKTQTLLNGARPNGCPALVQPDLAKLVNDKQTGIADTLNGIRLENMLQGVNTILAKVKQDAPSVAQADIVNGLTIAYCPVVEGLQNMSQPQKTALLDHFAERVYTQLTTNLQD